MARIPFGHLAFTTALAAMLVAAPVSGWAQRPAAPPTPVTPPPAATTAPVTSMPSAPAPSTRPPQVAAPLGTPSGLPALTFDEIIGETGANKPVHIGAIGLGAVAGVIAFNMAGFYLFPGSFAGGGPLAGTVVAESALAASRIYAVSSAALGGYVAHWLSTR